VKKRRKKKNKKIMKILQKHQNGITDSLLSSRYSQMKPVHLSMTVLVLTTAVLPGGTGPGPDVRRRAARLVFTNSLVLAGMHSGM
jgi:hypothetical protein